MFKAKSPAKIAKESLVFLTRSCRKSTLFRIPGEGQVGDWRTITAPYSKQVADWLRAKYPNVIIANEDLETQSKEWVKIVDNRFSEN
jgi:hypothetical protein